MAAPTDNVFEVLSREEAAPEVESPATVVTQEDVKQGVSAPGAVEQEVKVATGGLAWQVDAPPTPGRSGPLPKAQPPIEPDVSKAPGDISYAQAAKKHGKEAQGKAGESAAAGKEAVGEAAQVVKAKAGEVGVSAQHAGAELHERAAETGEVAKLKSEEMAESAKHAATDVRQRAEELAGATRERAAQAGEAAREYTEAARDKAADVAHSVSDSVTTAVEYIKEHLPEVHVEHAETSPEERESQALLDEAMALAGGTPMPIRTPSSAVAEPVPATTTTTPAPATAATPPSASRQTVAELGAEPFRAYEPRTATDVANRVAERAAEVSEAARVNATELVAGTPGSTATPERADSAREAAKVAAPDELAARVEREEQSAKGTLEALADAMKGAAEYVNSRPGSPHITERPGEPEVVVVRRSGSGRVHEYSALPGDIHPAQLARAAKVVREKVMHAPVATEATATEARDSTVGGMRAAGQGLEDTARAAADKAEGAYEQARGAVSSATDTASAKLESTKGAASKVAGRTADTVRCKADTARGAAERAETEHEARAGKVSLPTEKHEGVKAVAFEKGGTNSTAADRSVEGTVEAAREHSAGTLASARDAVTGVVQAAEEKAKWAYEHTKEELQQGAEHWSPGPQTPEEEARSAGIIPMDTETILKQRGEASYEEHEAREDEERNKMRTRELVDEAAMAYGEENLVPTGLSDVQEEAEGGGRLADLSGGSGATAGPSGGKGIKGALGRVSAGAREAAHEIKEELKEVVHELEKDRPGDEGEIPS